MNRPYRALGLGLLDLVCLYFAGLLGSTLILSGTIDHGQVVLWSSLASIFLPVQLVINYYFGLYSRIWRYASINELVSVVAAATLGTGVVFLTLSYRAGFQVLVFRTVPLYWLLTTAVLGGLRFAVRVRRELLVGKTNSGQPVLIIGAGEGGNAVCRAIKLNPQMNFRVQGFIDDNPARQGLELQGLRVLGSLAHLERFVEELAVQQVILTVQKPASELRALLNRCARVGVSVLIVPSVTELLSTQSLSQALRQISLEDLLRREEVTVDINQIAEHIKGKRVLVTGAGGSIGFELCKQVAHCAPAELIMVGHGENSIHDAQQRLASHAPDCRLTPVIADVRSAPRIRRVFEAQRPHIVFHAAAHKHVPLMEVNPEEAISNNVLGTYNVAKAASFVGVESFVLISSDKAVNPFSVMGASKRLAEMVVEGMASHSHTRFITVRFGNVLGSRGSVVPLFEKQIAQGGPITVTHPDMERFFMTIPEAVSLVLQAMVFGHGGEVFVLDMGKRVKIEDLARDMVVLSGKVPDRDIKILYTGIRPGEKLIEELYTENEALSPTPHPRIGQIRKSTAFGAETVTAVEALLGEALPDDELVRALYSIALQSIEVATAREGMR